MALDCSASFSMETVVYSATRMRTFAYKALGELIDALESGTQWDAIIACDTLLQDVDVPSNMGTGWRLSAYLRDPEVRFIGIVNRHLLDMQDSVNNI